MAQLELENLTDRQEFHGMFEITRNITFEVAFYTLGSNKNPRLTTSASQLNRPKSDYNRCGQAQDGLLPKGSGARLFYEKWDNKHLSDLTDEEYNDLVFDLGVLDLRYNAEFYDNSIQHIPFYKVVELSKTPLKPKPKLVRV